MMANKSFLTTELFYLALTYPFF